MTQPIPPGGGLVTVPAGGGVIADDAPHELPDGAWSYGSNVVFRDAFAAKADGYRAVLTQPVGKAYNVASYPAGAEKWWIHSTLTRTFADDGAAQVEITSGLLTGNEDARFTSTVMGGVYVQNNQADAPQWWGGSGVLAAVPGWDAAWRCKSLRAFKAYLLALNVTKGATNYGSMIKWSHRADPGTLPTSWDEADPTMDAGEADLSDTPDSIVDGLPLGDSFIVYKERSAYALQYTGDSSIFRASRLPGEYGMLAQNCGAITPAGHVVLTAGPDLVLHNGGEPRSILQGRMRRWLSSNLDSNTFGRSFVVPVLPRGEVWVCIPENSQTACTKALVWNFLQDTFSVIDLPNATAAAVGPMSLTADETWDTLSAASWDTWDGAWDQMDISLADRRVVMASDNSALYLMGKGEKADTADQVAIVERKGMVFGSPDVVKLLCGVIPRFDAPAGTLLTIQAGGSMDAEVEPTWCPETSYVVGSTRRADLFCSGRFLALRIKSSGAGAWRLKTCTFDVKPTGVW